MLITITEFAEVRNTDRDTVNAFIRKHPEIKQYVTKEGKHTVIDSECDGYKALEKKYPLPQMVQIIEDTESRKQLIKAQEVIIQMQAKMNEQAHLIAKAEATEMLLEDKKIQLEQANERINYTEDELKRERERHDETRTLLEEERSKGWFKKLLGK